MKNGPGSTQEDHEEQARARTIVDHLSFHYPEAVCTLDHGSPWELLVGAILASQCTDARVNKITPHLFSRYPDIESMASAERSEIEKIIRSCGFFRMKGKALKGTATILLEQFDGQVPSSAEDLIELPGVGRKITNLILGDVFGEQAIVVDTHCGRISKLLGFTDSENPLRIERDLMEVLPHDSWTLWGHLLVAHGRIICKARCRDCFACPVRGLCRYGKSLDPSAGVEGDCV
ncbi:MAG: endonuclease III [Clostridiaceae bacterium]|nr:endonuclease III [Clostridiaceae bacterium]